MSSAYFFVLMISMISIFLEFRNVFAFPFDDVSIQAGMDYSKGPRKKYGGPCIADLNGDGFPDLLLAHHDDMYAEVYLNNGNGKFNSVPWNYWDDTHALVPFRTSPSQKDMNFILMRGGSNGLKPTAPLVFTINSFNMVFKLSMPSFATGRGRTAIFLPLDPDQPGVNNAIFINAPALIDNDPRNTAGKALPDGTFTQLSLLGFEKERNSFAAVLDVDGDGFVEFCTYENFRIYKVTSLLTVKEISGAVLPVSLRPIRGVIAVAELDFDNDGKMDLYIARTSTEDLKWLQTIVGTNPQDYLLRNVGGEYVDVTKSALIPGNGDSRGVTVGDFNNDGWTDILVSQYDSSYRLLWNNGDGTFRNYESNFGRPLSAHGDQPAAIDYDRDGKLDLVLSEGDYGDREHGGQFRIMKNIGNHPNYLLVRVGNSPKRTATSLHAIARVKAGSRLMTRRVGSQSTAISVSYIELLHFGLGSKSSVGVTVTWADGSKQKKTKVTANSLVSFGVL